MQIMSFGYSCMVTTLKKIYSKKLVISITCNTVWQVILQTNLNIETLPFKITKVHLQNYMDIQTFSRKYIVLGFF